MSERAMTPTPPEERRCKHPSERLKLQESFGYPGWQCTQCGAYLDRKRCEELGIRSALSAQKIKHKWGGQRGI